MTMEDQDVQLNTIIRDFLDIPDEDDMMAVKFEIADTVGNDGKPKAFWSKLPKDELVKMVKK